MPPGRQQPLDVEATFAGFDWPRYLPALPKGTKQQRLDRYKFTGGYQLQLVPGKNSMSFYLDSDFMPGLRWKWCDAVEGVRIDHTGWFNDDFGNSGNKTRGLVMRLPHGRGFLAGWSLGKGMASAAQYYVFTEEDDAAREANRLAESIAEDEREHAHKQQEEEDVA